MRTKCTDTDYRLPYILRQSPGVEVDLGVAVDDDGEGEEVGEDDERVNVRLVPRLPGPCVEGATEQVRLRGNYCNLTLSRTAVG